MIKHIALAPSRGGVWLNNVQDEPMYHSGSIRRQGRPPHAAWSVLPRFTLGRRYHQVFDGLLLAAQAAMDASANVQVPHYSPWYDVGGGSRWAARCRSLGRLQ